MLTFCGKHFAVYVTSLCDCVVHLKLFYGTRCQFHLIEIGVKKKRERSPHRFGNKRCFKSPASFSSLNLACMLVVPV